MVISWRLNSLHKNIADNVLFLQTASEIRTELNHHYAQSNGALLYQIQQQLYSISQGFEDFSTYFTKLSKICDQLGIVQGISPCSCASATAINKVLEDQRLIQLLMGLNESYKIIRGQILMIKPLPTISTVYSHIIQEERQRGITTTSPLNPHATAMHVSTDSSNSKKQLFCNHCKKSGHTKSQWYRLVGFPTSFKFTKVKKKESKPTVQNVTTMTAPDISQEQYDICFNFFVLIPLLILHHSIKSIHLSLEVL